MFLALRELRSAKGRFTLVGAVVFLLTVLVVLLSGLTAGLARQNTSAITELPADLLTFSADSDDISFSDSRLDAGVAADLAAQDGVTSAASLGITPARMDSGGRSRQVAAFGVGDAGGPLVPGVPPTDGQVTLSTELADDWSLHTGDVVMMSDVELVVADVSDDRHYSHMPVAWLRLADWHTVAGGAPDTVTVIASSTDAGADLDAFDAAAGTRTVPVGESLSAIGSYTAENNSLQMMRVLLFIIASLVVGAFFTVWTIQRRGDIAVVMALGGHTAYVLRDSLGQVTLVLAAGAVAGGIGAAVAGAVVSRAVPFVLDFGTVAVPVTIMLVLGLLGAVAALRSITTVDPLTALEMQR